MSGHLKIFMATCWVLITVSAVSAQTANADAEKALKAEKVAFITSKLELTPKEAKKFWPVYDAYWDKKNEVLRERRALTGELTKIIEQSPDDKTLLAYADRYVENRQRETELLVKLNEELKEILPPRKILLLYKANHEFKNYLLQKVQETGK
jgi:Spy/CpxP family protein refolding chaperone